MSERVPGPVTFTWTIRIDKTSRKSWESPEFSFMNQSGTKLTWQMIFCSESPQESNDVDHGSLTVQYCGEAESADSVFVIKLCVSQGKRTDDCLSYEKHVVSYDDTEGNNVPQNFSEKNSHEILVPQIVDNEFQLRVSCTILAKYSNVELHENFLSQHEISLKREFELLFENGKYSDVTFIIDEQKLQLHKNIISSRVPAFAAMFNNDFKENVSNEVHIKDQPFEVMKEFFRYVYAARINDIENFANGLLIVANKYAVENLKSLCEQTLGRSLRCENIFDRLSLANLHDAKNLESECVKFVVSNVKEIVKLPQFHIGKLPIDFANEVFKLVAEKS